MRSPGVGGADPIQQLQHAESADRIPRVVRQPQEAEHVFHMRRFQKLQPAVFDEWDAAASEFNLELVAMVAGAEQHGLSFQVNAGLTMLQDTLDDGLDLRDFIGRQN